MKENKDELENEQITAADDVNAPDGAEDTESNEARKLRLLGDEPQSESEPVPPPATPSGKLENFWYHYKWRTIIVCFFVFFAVIATTQLLSREKADIYVIYTGSAYINSSANDNLRKALRACMLEDYNGDGTLGVMYTDITYMSDAQIQQVYAEAEAEDVDVALDLNANREAHKRFNNEIFAGESVICFLDPLLYDDLVNAGGLLSLDELWDGEVPEDISAAACGEYGLVLSKTAFGEYYGSVIGMPDDTVLCIRRLSTMGIFKGMKKTEKVHEYHINVFKNIAEFSPPAA